MRDDHRATFSAITAARRRPLFDPIGRPQAEPETEQRVEEVHGDNAKPTGRDRCGSHVNPSLTKDLVNL